MPPLPVALEVTVKLSAVLNDAVSNSRSKNPANQTAVREDQPAKFLVAKRFLDSEQQNAMLNVESTLTAVKPVVNGLGLRLEFSQDAHTGIRVIKVIDLETGEVVRQIPPQETLAFLRQLHESKEVFLSLRL